jgi:hypothetical protein
MFVRRTEIVLSKIQDFVAFQPLKQLVAYDAETALQ